MHVALAYTYKEQDISILWLSIGENCLPADVLHRHGKVTDATIYATSRSNIDYALAIEAARGKGILEIDRLYYAYFGEKRVVRSNLVVNSAKIFHESVSNGFEFTHHDPIASDEDRIICQRKLDLLASLKKSDEIVLLYHHRLCSESNIPILKDKLGAFVTMFEERVARCNVVLFYQIKTTDDRKLIFRQESDGVLEFVFQTNAIWAGQNSEIFWGRVDDQLFAEMFKIVDERLTRLRGLSYPLSAFGDSE